MKINSVVIDKVCSLEYTYDELLSIATGDIVCDMEYAFEKYYNINTIC